MHTKICFLGSVNLTIFLGFFRNFYWVGRKLLPTIGDWKLCFLNSSHRDLSVGHLFVQIRNNFFSKILGKGPDLKLWSKFRDFLSWCLGHYHPPLGAKISIFGLPVQESVGLTPFFPDPEQKQIRLGSLGSAGAQNHLSDSAIFTLQPPKLFT